MKDAIYQNKNEPVEKRISDLLARMTIEEKVGQMMQLPANKEIFIKNLENWNIGSYLHCTGQQIHNLQKRAEKTRLGIPLIFGIDAIHGHCFEDNGTVFPTQLAMSNSWDTDMIRRCGRVTAKEVRTTGIHWTFSPVLCVGRDSRWGRIDETFGEDAWLCGEFALALVGGYQGNGDFSDETNILACGKHFVGYGETIGARDAYDAHVSKKELLNTFLPPFEKIVKLGNVASLMTGYHAIDGVPCTANKWLLKDIPRSWNMDGIIITDWDNVKSLHVNQKVAENEKEAAYLAIKAGNNMIMTTESFYKNTLELIKEHHIKESEIDELITPILKMKFKLGLFDKNRYADSTKSKIILGNEDHWKVGLEASKKSVVLLKNNGILPLKKNKNHLSTRILVTGPNADDLVAQLGDWSFGSGQAQMLSETFHRKEFVSILKGIQTEFGEGAVVYNKGCDVIDPDKESIAKSVTLAEKSDVIVAVIGDTKSQHGEFYDRANLDLSGAQLNLLKALKTTGKPLVVILISSKPLAISWVKEHADAILVAFNPGSKGGIAIAKTLSGEYNPSGKLTISFPHHSGQLPVYYNSFHGWHAGGHHARDGYCDLPADPVFSFGEGLSYTEFEYSSLHIKNTKLKQSESLELSITIHNTGKRSGEEIVQVYFQDLYSSVTTPIKELRAYQKIFLNAGEEKKLHFSINYDEFSLINSDLQRIVEKGDFEVYVGSSSKDEDLLIGRFSVI